MAMRVSSLRRAFGANVVTPTPPSGTGVVFHNRMQPVKYALNGKEWTLIVSSGFFGAFAGNAFFKFFILKKNPPNPPRFADEQPPEKHPHAPEDE